MCDTRVTLSHRVGQLPLDDHTPSPPRKHLVVDVRRDCQELVSVAVNMLFLPAVQRQLLQLSVMGLVGALVRI